MSVSSQDKVPVQTRAEIWKGAAVAVVLAVAIIAVAKAAGDVAAKAFDAWSGIREVRAFKAGEPEALLTGRVASSLFAFQAVTVTSLLLLNAWRRRRPGSAPFLKFEMPPGGVKTILLSIVSLAALAMAFASCVYVFNPDALKHDLQPFAEMMNSRAWWLILLAAGIGAPLAEECLFRGLLFGALRPTPLGFTGAALITAVTWALLHANYSPYGIAAITLIGLYLAWLRERTGGLLTPVVCHGAYNSMIILLMAFSGAGALG